MGSSDSVQLNLEISVSDAADDEIDRTTRQLLSESKKTDVETAELAKGGRPPEGSEGDPVTLGSIALAVLPGALPKVIDSVQSWSLGGPGWTVKFKGEIGGKTIEVEGSSDEFQELIPALEKGKKK